MQNVIKIIVSFSFFLICLFSNAQNINSFDRPCGIYTKGAAQPGQYLSAIRNLPFVDGHLLLMRWEQIEIGENIFDFSIIDQAVQTLQGYNQNMTLLILCSTVPSYLINDPNVEKYLNISPLGDVTTITAVPWDPIATARQINFLDSISSHLVFDSISQSMIPLKDHPVLKQVGVQVIGVGSLRDPQGSISNIPGYSRPLISATFINTTQQYLNKFPNKFIYLGILRINDSNTSPDLTTYLLNNLNGAFNSGASPTLGYINEQLACSTPNTNSAFIFSQIDITFTMFQMLSSWRNPSPTHSVQTNPCLSNSTGPDVAMQYGLDNYNSTYFELWVQDIDWPGYNILFQTWHDSLQVLCNQSLGISDFSIDKNNTFIYPNPVSENGEIKSSKIFNSIEIYSAMGVLVEKYNFADENQFKANVSDLSNGVYFIKVLNESNVIGVIKMLKIR